jgi:magnesium-transporting ATPase (P-type)
MESIRHLGSATAARVIRGGKVASIPISDVVVGDIVELKQGDVVCADIRMFEVRNAAPFSLRSLLPRV